MTTNKHLSIGSLNIHHIGSHSNTDIRRRKFHWLKSQSVDVYFLQDVHAPSYSTPYTGYKLSPPHWPFSGIWRKYTAVISNRPSLEIRLVASFLEDRVLVTQLYNLHDTSCPTLCLVCVYAPSTSTARRTFFDQFPWDQLPKDYLLAGDFNDCLDRTLDRLPADPSISMTWPIFQRGLDTSHLFDLHRFHDPGKIDFSMWFTQQQSSFHGRVATRIDYFFAPLSLLSQLSPVDYQVCAVSDHRMLVTFWRPPSTTAHGRSFWRLNSAILAHDEYKLMISTLWKDLQIIRLRLADDLLFWDYAKSSFQAASQLYSHHHLQSLHKSARQIQRRIRSIQQYLISCPDTEISSLQQSLLGLEAELAMIHYAKWKRSAAKARLRWSIEGEKNTAYFQSFFRRKATSSGIIGLQNSSGQVDTSSAGILCITRDFYASLYSQPPAHHEEASSQQRLLDCLDYCLPSTAEQQLAQVIHQAEVESTILHSPKRRAPGGDGLPFEFYQTFQDLLAVLYLFKLLSFISFTRRLIQQISETIGQYLCFVLILRSLLGYCVLACALLPLICCIPLSLDLS
jgi:exonuclease III